MFVFEELLCNLLNLGPGWLEIIIISFIIYYIFLSDLVISPQISTNITSYPPRLSATLAHNPIANNPRIGRRTSVPVVGMEFL